MKIAILDDYLEVALKYAPFQDLGPAHQLSVFSEGIAGDDLVKTLRGFDVLLVMRERTAFPAQVIEQLPNLKLIVTTGRRNDVIDMDACKSAGITVCGTDSPGYGTAELTFALILAAAKGVITEHNHMRGGGWQSALGEFERPHIGCDGPWQDRWTGGQVCAGNGDECYCLEHEPYQERTEECGVEYVSKQELMSRSDFMTIHLRLSDHTHHLVKAEDLAMMKEGSWIINTSRAPIIDMSALLSELQTGRICAALDVFETEPLGEDDELRTLPNVILSPHKGYCSVDTFKVFYQQTYDNLLAWLDNKPINLIT